MNARVANLLAGLLAAIIVASGTAFAAGDYEKPVERDYAFTPPAPRSQSQAEADAKSAGCVSCHTASDAKTMHRVEAVVLGCADCHGGDAGVMKPAGVDDHLAPAYEAAREAAHVLPKYPESWHYPHSENPKRSYALLNKESPEFARFVNPSDYRVAREACGACHLEVIQAAERSLMATGAMLWGGAAYNNGILPFKNYILGEAYTREGEPAGLCAAGEPANEPQGPLGCPQHRI